MSQPIQYLLDTTLAFITPSTGWVLIIPVLAGAYIIYLRNLGHCPPDLRLRRKGLDSLIAGRPDKAEKFFRRGLSMVGSDRVRFLVCLGDALMDQGRFPESKECLASALELGDPTGSGQGSMTDLLLLTRTDPEKALDMADEAVALTTNGRIPDIYFGGDVYNDIKRSIYWARRSQALVQLNRLTEARQALDRALRLVEAAHADVSKVSPRSSIAVKLVLGNRVDHHRDLAISRAHWIIGLALLAIDDKNKAADHFRITRDTDRRGKYRRLAQQQLERLDNTN
jgi:tetratricopeptide (TPR) repeat protein